MIQLGKDDVKSRQYPRTYGLWATAWNDYKSQQMLITRKPYHQSKHCDGQNKFICQRPAAAQEGAENTSMNTLFPLIVFFL